METNPKLTLYNINLHCMKNIAIVLAFMILYQAVFPTFCYALTSGPSQPEYSTFEPITATQMVDLFTGDFNYNIPLLNIPGPNGGYPINLFYHSVTNMEEEASMVGLGWNIGLGAIQRHVRGVPDDFDGEMVERKVGIKESWTASVTANAGTEAFGYHIGEQSAFNLSSSLTAKYNNYKGVGYALGYNFSAQPESSIIGFNGGVTYDSYDGVTYSGGVDLNYLMDESSSTYFNAGLGFTSNSLSGKKSLNFDASIKTTYEYIKQNNYNKTQYLASGENKYVSVSGSFSDRPVFNPSYELDRTGSDFALGVELGIETFGLFNHLGFAGAFNRRELKYNYKWRNIPSFGSMYLGKAQNVKNAVMDFNRIKESPIMADHQNLYVPISTEDYFTLSGHGTGGQFKIFRSDIGIFKDKVVKSTTEGISATVHGGGGAFFNVGVDASVPVTSESNDVFSNKKMLSTDPNENPNVGLKFQNKSTANNFEPYYFMNEANMSGELTTEAQHSSTEYLEESYEYLGGDDLVEFEVKPSNILSFQNPTLTSKLFKVSDKNSASSEIAHNQNLVTRENRRPRGEVIKEYTGKLITSNPSGSPQKTIIPSLDVSIYKIEEKEEINHTDFYHLENFERENNNKISAFTQFKSDGTRYNYGLPVMNIEQVDARFSVGKQTTNDGSINIPLINGYDLDDVNSINSNVDDIPGSENFIDIRKTPSYAHSYLMTSILGNDYQDINSNDGGPNIFDKGYWVRFHYMETKDFKWRIPFKQADFVEGSQTTDEDNKAFFSYGKRKQYYPYIIETATHICEFHYTQRDDNRGAKHLLQNSAEYEAHSYKLDKIVLRARGNTENSENSIIKAIEFNYYDKAGELCQMVENNETAVDVGDGGKLTLKSVNFKNFKSKRGELNPYVFTYNEDGNKSKGAYSKLKKDKWGMYKDHDTYSDFVQDPYASQVEGTVDEEEINEDARLWHLSKISLPTGATINVEVSRDHYSHVQDRQATKMYRISGIAGPQNYNINVDDDRIYFKPETPLFQKSEMLPYFEGLYEPEPGASTVIPPGGLYRQIIFKAEVELVKNKYEFVIGSANMIDYGLTETGDCFIQLEPLTIKYNFGLNEEDVHPVMAIGWQNLKINHRHLIDPISSMVADDNNESSIVLKLLNKLPNIINLFKGFYDSARTTPFAKRIRYNNSFIKLNKFDKKKFGGNIKVDKITYQNIWDQNLEANPSYGKIYIYEGDDTYLDNNNLSVTTNMSYGVAANEPAIGSEEIAYRYMKPIDKKMKFSSDRLFFDQHPYNDAFFPASVVGYRKVIVRSLASELAYQKFANSADEAELLVYPYLNDEIKDLDIKGTGQEIHEFFTAKDFPVILSEKSPNERVSSPNFKFFPSVGVFKSDIYAGTQAYKVETNDMHGKMKSIHFFGQSKNGDFLTVPESSITNEYLSEDYTYNFGERKYTCKKLVSEVPLLTKHDYYRVGATNVYRSSEKGELGVSRQLITDYRDIDYFSGVYGLNPNVDGFSILPATSATPQINHNVSRVQVGVTNKIISRKGILSNTIINDGQSSVSTKNEVYDPLTGEVLCKKTSNHFDEPVFNYTVPAYVNHPRMGPAYKNIGTEFIVPKNAIKIDEENDVGYLIDEAFIDPSIVNNLVPGDEFLIKLGFSLFGYVIDVPNEFLYRGCYFGKQTCGQPNQKNNYLFTISNFDESLLPPENFLLDYIFKFTNIRSGNRNMLQNPGQQIVALSNPSRVTHEPSAVIIPSTLTDVPSTPEQRFIFTLDEVLDATAYTYSDIWEPLETLEETNCDDDNTIASRTDHDFFVSGKLGNFKLHEQLSYLADRKNDDVNKKGVFEDFKLFDARSLYFRLTAEASNWLITQKLTQYAQSNMSKESKNAIDIYASNLLCPISYAPINTNGIGESVVIASAQNARNKEIAFTSFESYERKLSKQNSNNDYIVPSNFLLTDPTDGELLCIEQYNIVDRFWNENDTNDPNQIIVDLDFNLYSQQRFLDSELILVTSDKEKVEKTKVNLIDGNPVTPFPICVDNMGTSFCNDAYGFYHGKTLSSIKFNAKTSSVFSIKKGKLFVRQKLLENTGNLDFTNSESHTGESSLLVSGNSNESLKFSTMLLEPKKYQVSLWVKSGSNNLVNDLEISIIHNGVNVGQQLLSPADNPVNGWSRVAFTFDVGEPTIWSSANYVQFNNNSSSDVFIDDLRIQPVESAMECYVYNPDNYLLKAKLDDNNYFTKYQYNGNGDLISTIQETEKGIISLSESKTFISPQE